MVGAGQLLRHLVDKVDSELAVAEFDLQTLQKGRHNSDENNGVHNGDSLSRHDDAHGIHIYVPLDCFPL